MPSTIDKKQIGVLHIYPADAGLTDSERRDVLEELTGARTSKGLSNAQFELVMARYEAILWDRVRSGLARDPRLCRKCNRALKSAGNGYGACPGQCEPPRKVHAWTTDYWRNRLPTAGKASTRQLHKLRQLWTLLGDYLTEDRHADIYLAAIICHAVAHDEVTRQLVLARIFERGILLWDQLQSNECHAAIEALKDRLSHAV